MQCSFADGTNLPWMFIFSGARIPTASLKARTPIDTLICKSESGWMDHPLFMQW
jgi:hypothetical protein